MNLIKSAMPSWTSRIKKANQVLQEKFAADVFIDEISLLFRSDQEAKNFALAAVMEEGVVLFNAAADHVHTWPLDTKYDVNYLFLTLPENVDGHAVRLEVMSLESGFSPLHYGLLSTVGSTPVVVHLSFKVKNEEHYQQAVDMMCADDDFWMVQACRSAYGRFAYFRTPLMEGAEVFIKPRVNLRDEMMKDLLATAEEAENKERGDFGLPGIGSLLSPSIPRDH